MIFFRFGMIACIEIELFGQSLQRIGMTVLGFVRLEFRYGVQKFRLAKFQYLHFCKPFNHFMFVQMESPPQVKPHVGYIEVSESHG